MLLHAFSSAERQSFAVVGCQLDPLTRDVRDLVMLGTAWCLAKDSCPQGHCASFKQH